MGVLLADLTPEMVSCTLLTHPVMESDGRRTVTQAMLLAEAIEAATAHEAAVDVQRHGLRPALVVVASATELTQLHAVDTLTGVPVVVLHDARDQRGAPGLHEVDNLGQSKRSA